MAHLLSFLPLRQETIGDIRGRMDADANAGLDPEDASFIDTTPGGWYYDITQVLGLEIERLWDMAATDVPAVGFVDFAWGSYLDAHGAEVGLARKTAAAATGSVTFTGTNGTPVPIGTEISTISTNPDEEPVSFITTASGVVAGGTLTLAVEAFEAGATGNVAAGAASLLLSSVPGLTGPHSNASAITGGSDTEADDLYRERLKIEKSVAQGAGSVGDYRRWALQDPSVGFVRVVPLWNGAGSVRVVITDLNNDPVSPAVEARVQANIDPYTAETATVGSHTLPVGTITVSSTALFGDSGRIYVGTSLVSYTSKDATHFLGCTGGSGTYAAGTQVVQHGEGKGLAPVGAIVTVDTPAGLTVNVAADVTLRDGYSIDGTDGKIAVNLDIREALLEYIDSLPPGGEDPPGAETPAGSGFVLRNKVESRFFRVEGLYDVTGVTLNGVAADLAVGALQVPALGTIVLT